MNEDRARISAKIRALLAKTTENGATEAEAMAAAEKASELMGEYNLSMRDVQDVKDESWGKRARPFGKGSSRRRHYHEVSNSMGAIAAFCDCKVWVSGGELVFFGTQTDTEIAHYMFDMLRETMDREYRRFEKSEAGRREKQYGTHGKTMRAAFMLGFVVRVNARLRQMKAEREATMRAASVTGTALVVVKGQELARRFNALGVNPRTVAGNSGGRGNSTAMNAGKAAGDRANLSSRGAVSASQRQIR